MPSSVIEATNSAVCEIFTDDTNDEDSPTPCNKVTLKTDVEHTKHLLTKKRLNLQKSSQKRNICNNLLFHQDRMCEQLSYYLERYP